MSSLMSKECRDVRFEIANCDEKRKEWRLEAFIVETKNEGDAILPKYWRENLNRWIRIPSYDVWSVTQPKAFNDALQVPKR